MPNISVIIPNNNSTSDLINLITAVCNQTIKPFEIIIINSSIEFNICPSEVKKLCNLNNIKLLYEYKIVALPGHARNIGLNLANANIIAFIDVKTIPRAEWLEISLNLLNSQIIDGVYGSTKFIFNTKFEKLVRDGFHGVLPCRTLPGTVCRKEVIVKTGQFIDWVRAGEDTEWILRLQLHKLTFISPKTTLIDYSGLIGLTLMSLLKKWKRNYEMSRELPHFFPQRLILWLIFYPIIILISFNWNYLIADWRNDSPFFIGHITKIVCILPILSYIIIRGLVLPYKKGVPANELLPFRFIIIIIICFMADIIKLLAFSIPKFKIRNLIIHKE